MAPGTTAMQVAGVQVYDPYATSIVDLRGLDATINTTSRMRWDLIIGVGGGALVVALAAGLLAHNI